MILMNNRSFKSLWNITFTYFLFLRVLDLGELKRTSWASSTLWVVKAPRLAHCPRSEVSCERWWVCGGPRVCGYQVSNTWGANQVLEVYVWVVHTYKNKEQSVKQSKLSKKLLPCYIGTICILVSIVPLDLEFFQTNYI